MTFFINRGSMKKSIIVLLIAVLVAGFAFAGKITGSAGLQFNVDLQNKQWGFKNANDWNYTFTFTYDTTTVKVAGEGNAYAELEIKGTATAAVSGKQIASTNVLVGTDPSKGNGTITDKVEVTLSKANIVFVIGEKKLVFDLLNTGAAKDFAKSFHSPAKKTVAGPDETLLPGFNVSYDGYTGGFGARGNWTDEDFFYNIFAHAESKTFDFAEKKVTLQAGVWTVLSNDPNILGSKYNKSKNFGGGFTSTVKPADKIAVKVDTDLAYFSKTKNFDYEVAAQAKYTFVEKPVEALTLDVYVTPGRLISTTNYKDDTAETPFLAAKLNYATHVFDFSETADLKLSGYVQIDDALIEKRELIVSATEVLDLLQNKKLALTFTETYKVLVAKELAVTAEAKYTADEKKFVATAKVSPTFDLKEDAAKLLKQLKFECEIYSEAIINLAKIGLKYSGADFVKNNQNKITNMGKISAYATISFSGESGK